MSVANEAPCSWLGYGVWSTPRTCIQFCCFVMGSGYPENHHAVFWSLIWATLDMFGRPSIYSWSSTTRWRFVCRIWSLVCAIYVENFRKTFIIFAEYNHEIYFRSNCLALLHVKGLSSWWISSKIQFCLVCAVCEMVNDEEVFVGVVFWVRFCI